MFIVTAANGLFSTQLTFHRNERRNKIAFLLFQKEKEKMDRRLKKKSTQRGFYEVNELFSMETFYLYFWHLFSRNFIILVPMSFDIEAFEGMTSVL